MQEGWVLVYDISRERHRGHTSGTVLLFVQTTPLVVHPAALELAEQVEEAVLV